MLERTWRLPVTTRFTLENDPDQFTARGVARSARLPFGKGQRVRIGGPPGTGATTLLQAIAAGLAANHPEVRTFVLLVDGQTASCGGI